MKYFDFEIDLVSRVLLRCVGRIASHRNAATVTQAASITNTVS